MPLWHLLSFLYSLSSPDLLRSTLSHLFLCFPFPFLSQTLKKKKKFLYSITCPSNQFMSFVWGLLPSWHLAAAHYPLLSECQNEWKHWSVFVQFRYTAGIINLQNEIYFPDWSGFPTSLRSGQIFACQQWGHFVRLTDRPLETTGPLQMSLSDEPRVVGWARVVGWPKGLRSKVIDSDLNASAVPPPSRCLKDICSAFRFNSLAAVCFFYIYQSASRTSASADGFYCNKPFPFLILWPCHSSLQLPENARR